MSNLPEDVGSIFEELGDLEREFADVELDARTVAMQTIPRCTLALTFH